jgi:hypothetical protein
MIALLKFIYIQTETRFVHKLSLIWLLVKNVKWCIRHIPQTFSFQNTLCQSAVLGILKTRNAQQGSIPIELLRKTHKRRILQHGLNSGACNTEAGTDTWGFMEHCRNWHCQCLSMIVSAFLWDMKCNASGTCEFWLPMVSMGTSHEDTITDCETTGVE